MTSTARFVATVLTAVFGVPGLFLATALPVFASGAVPERSAEGAVIVLATTERERGTGAGTIVAVSGDSVRIVTAKHVAVFGALTVRFDSTTSAPARILESIPGHDVAVIEATVDPAVAATLHPARVGTAHVHQAVHIRGSGFDGPDFEPASITQTSGDLPDGPAAGRVALTCALCHRGDSGGGVYDESGTLVGIYVGYWTYETGERVSIAEVPATAVREAMTAPALPAARSVALAGTSNASNQAGR